MSQIFIQSKPTDCPLVKKKKKSCFFLLLPNFFFLGATTLPFCCRYSRPMHRNEEETVDLSWLQLLFYFIFFFRGHCSHWGYRRAFDDGEKRVILMFDWLVPCKISTRWPCSFILLLLLLLRLSFDFFSLSRLGILCCNPGRKTAEERSRSPTDFVAKQRPATPACYSVNRRSSFVQ